ncbi:MAG: hypothetical protein WC373_10745 [Smithella sp.]
MVKKILVSLVALFISLPVLTYADDDNWVRVPLTPEQIQEEVSQARKEAKEAKKEAREAKEAAQKASEEAKNSRQKEVVIIEEHHSSEEVRWQLPGPRGTR